MSKIMKYLLEKKINKIGLYLALFSLIINICLSPTTKNINVIIFICGFFILRLKNY